MLEETRTALARAMKFIETIEYVRGHCPICGGHNPFASSVGDWHGRYGHDADCEMGKLLGRSGKQFSCDCYMGPGHNCNTHRPTFGGKRWAALSVEERTSLVQSTIHAE